MHGLTQESALLAGGNALRRPPGEMRNRAENAVTRGCNAAPRDPSRVSGSLTRLPGRPFPEAFRSRLGTGSRGCREAPAYPSHPSPLWAGEGRRVGEANCVSRRAASTQGSEGCGLMARLCRQLLIQSVCQILPGFSKRHFHPGTIHQPWITLDPEV